MKNKTILITGSNGVVGKDLVKKLSKKYVVIDTALDHIDPKKKLDITDESKVNAYIEEFKPYALINCAAYTNVDAAEEQEAGKVAEAVNSDAVRILAESCKQNRVHFFHISTDYVFGVNTDEGFTEDFSTFTPINKYGESKLNGEKHIKAIFNFKEGTSDFDINDPKAYIIRTSWLFGHGSINFVSKMIELSEKYEKLQVVDDEISKPVSVDDFNKFLIQMLEDLPNLGIYHGVSEGVSSRYDFAKEIFKILKKEIEITPVPLSTFPRPAKISNRSYLLNTKRPKMRKWEEMLLDYLTKEST